MAMCRNFFAECQLLRRCGVVYAKSELKPGKCATKYFTSFNLKHAKASFQGTISTSIDGNVKKSWVSLILQMFDNPRCAFHGKILMLDRIYFRSIWPRRLWLGLHCGWKKFCPCMTGISPVFRDDEVFGRIAASRGRRNLLRFFLLMLGFATDDKTLVFTYFLVWASAYAVANKVGLRLRYQAYYQTRNQRNRSVSWSLCCRWFRDYFRRYHSRLLRNLGLALRGKVNSKKYLRSTWRRWNCAALWGCWWWKDSPFRIGRYDRMLRPWLLKSIGS